LLKIDGKVVERPQHMLMRVSIGIHGEDVDAAIEVSLITCQTTASLCKVLVQLIYDSFTLISSTFLIITMLLMVFA